MEEYGGTVSPGYSGVPYILEYCLVDPHKASGQNLWRQYAGKKGKIVLNSRWVHECIKANALQTFHTNWAGCKVTGTEAVTPVPELPPPASTAHVAETRSATRKRTRANESVEPASRQLHHPPAPPPPHALHAQVITPMVNSLVEAHNSFPYHSVYGANMQPPRPMQPPSAPSQTWQGSGGIAPQQTHLAPPPLHMLPRPQFRDTWDGYDHTTHPPEAMAGPSTATYDYRYRDEQSSWVPGPNPYYDPAAAYQQPYMEPAGAEANSTPVHQLNSRKSEGGNVLPTPATPAAALVVNKNPPARSPTPPTRVIKSTYGGNLFTSDDVLYLKEYIDYCQEQGLVLSLREICERIAVKVSYALDSFRLHAPHHTFYSWRRYCNKHQIRLGGYIMNHDRSESPAMDDGQEIEEENMMHSGPGPTPDPAAPAHAQTPGPRIDPSLPRNRSPTPPRALYRSTTGKGVAFTDEDINFLVRFMEYRKYVPLSRN
ncbi:hypothetical protein D9615_002661 [Tricholomella constricta]|uniref:BRCT domain-containing protein n=1 Tax=Tricholomella constricta TaxID=117010 RepID=A0A8H5HMR8_9AGAR|nr:hypothetical protein D9615_002661 [Tricholomella constricta]